MATKTEKYQEGGMPSNMQVCGVRTADLKSVQLEDGVVVLGDTYNLFNLTADEVCLSIGVDVLSASAASTVIELNLDAVAITGLTALSLAATGKTAGTTPAVDASGVINAIITGGAGGGLDIDVSIWAIVANVTSPVTQTAIDTPAP